MISGMDIMLILNKLMQMFASSCESKCGIVNWIKICKLKMILRISIMSNAHKKNICCINHLRSLTADTILKKRLR